MKRINWKAMFTKQVLMVLFDIVVVNLSYFAAQLSFLSMTENMDEMSLYMTIFAHRAIPVTLVFFMLFHAFRIYSSMWEYAGIRELSNVVIATFIGGLSSVAIDIAMSSFGFAISNIQNGCFNMYVYIFFTSYG